MDSVKITKDAINDFWKNFGTGFILFIMGVLVAIIFITLGDWLFDEGTLGYKVFVKLAEGSMFIGTAGLIGTVYIIFNRYRNKSNCSNEIYSNELNKKLIKKTYYVIDD